MNLTKTMRYLLLTVLAVSLWSCNTAEDDPFSGSDNYIISFSLTDANQSAYAMIEEGRIIFHTPDGFNLIGAAPDVILSENATIKPQPATITDWSSEYVFVVTSYNGETKSYRYTVENDELSEASTVMLTTQEEVDAFGAKGISTIKGNLIIGTASGVEFITSLEPLNKLREVSNGVTIKGTFSSEVLGGLNSLEKVGGRVRIETSGLKQAIFPALQSAMHIEVASTSLESISCPKLVEISGDLNFAVTVLTDVDMPKLEKVEGEVFFSVPVQRDPTALEYISFPNLKEVGGRFAFGESNLLKSISLPELMSAGSLTFGINSSTDGLTEISMPKLERCEGELRYHQLSAMSSIDIPSLTYIGGDLIAYYCYTERINLPKLETIGGGITLTSIGDLDEKGLGGFEKLSTLGGELYIGYSLRTTTTKLVLPPLLKNFKSLNLFDCNTLQLLDVTGYNIESLTLQRSTLIDLTIKGNEIFNGKVSINGDGSSIATSPYTYPFPVFDGIKEIGGLEFHSAVYNREIEVTGLTKINGNVLINDNGNLRSFKINDVTEITGDIITAGVGQLTDKKLEFASVTKIGGYIRLSDLYKTYGFYGEEISFPNLKTAGGVSLLINSSVKKIDMPLLTSIADSLIIISPVTTGNTMITEFDTFEKLTEVKAVRIELMKAATSYKGFRNCLNALTDETQWQLTNNKYNPSLADMKAGNWDE